MKNDSIFTRLRRTLSLALTALIAATMMACEGDDKMLTELPKPDDGNGNGTTEITPDKGITLYGLVSDKEGNPLEGVVVSDGYSVVASDKKGVYQIVRDPNAKHVFISVPSGYEIPAQANFGSYQGAYQAANSVTGSSSKPYRADFTLTKLTQSDKRFLLFGLGDPQPDNSDHIQRFRTEAVPDVKKISAKYSIPQVGIALGDILGKGDAQTFTSMKRAFGETGVPFFTTIGNHDKSSVDYTGDTYRDVLGPRWYSFNRGDVHIVSMDNVLYEGKKKYKGGITDRQLEWLRQDLSHVDKDKLVIFCAHIPFRGGTSVTDESHENYDGVLDLLSGFSEAHIMIGHTHYHQKYIHKRNGKTILEHVHGAACGAWWTANICADGTPNGYSVYEISGNTIANQYYKSTNKEADYQIRAYSATQVFGKSGSLTFGWAANAPAMNDAKCIVANVWNSDASGNWKVSLWQNGTKVCDMTRVKTYDYWAYAYHVLYYSKSVGTTWGKNLDHYYYGNLASGTPGAADFEIVAEDGMGNTYRTSKLQTDFTGF